MVMLGTAALPRTRRPLTLPIQGGEDNESSPLHVDVERRRPVWASASNNAKMIEGNNGRGSMRRPTMSLSIALAAAQFHGANVMRPDTGITKWRHLKTKQVIMGSTDRPRNGTKSLRDRRGSAPTDPARSPWPLDPH